MSSTAPSYRVVGRYALFDEIATGGMATVHYGRLLGQAGFSRVVAIKRLLPQFAADPDFVTAFVDEARLASRVRHVNVVPTLDVVAANGEVFVVMEYVDGDALSVILRRLRHAKQTLPPRLGASLMVGVLHGLHAAHEAKGERGEPLHIVHRDVSPQNVLVGVDGSPRVLDFGIARAASRFHATREGQVKGKLSYMAPEQLHSRAVGPFTDVYGAGVVLWEMLAGRRLFTGDSEGAILEAVKLGAVDSPGVFNPDVDVALDQVVMQALEREPARRFATAEAMARALEPFAAPLSEVGHFVRALTQDTHAARLSKVAAVEAAPGLEVASDADAVLSEVRASKVGPPRGRWRSWVPAVLLALALVGVALLTVRAGRQVTPPAPTTLDVPPEPPPPVPARTTTPTAEPAPPATPTDTAAPHPTTRPAKRKPRASCNPPYTRDATGRIIWKRECL